MTTMCWAQVSRAALLSATLILVSPGRSEAPAPLPRQFIAGVQAYVAKDYPAAITHLGVSATEAPLLADYRAYYLASARQQTGDCVSVKRELAQVPADSVFAPKAAFVEAQCALALGDAQAGIAALRRNYKSLPQPDAALLLAQSYEAQGERVPAAALYAQVYYVHPATQAAVTASTALDRLRAQLGKDYPPPPPAQMLQRGDTWLALKNYSKAKAEYQSLYTQLAGAARDQALVRQSAADYLAGDARACRASLDKLHLAHSEADAERLYYLAECSRKLTDDATLTSALEQLARHYAASPWRLKALISAGNRYLLTHDAAHSVPLFRAAFEGFPEDKATAAAHWNVTWDAYRTHSPNARQLLADQAAKYPSDPRAASALYFLGRTMERARDYASAREIYSTLARVFPHYYYGVLAQSKLQDPEVTAAAAAPETAVWLNSLAFPPAPIVKDAADKATELRIERARLLEACGFADLAQAELRFGISRGGQRFALALELAKEDATPALALRHMKGLMPEYLMIPVANAPLEFWQYLFPFPYREGLTASAKAQGIDPFLLAGLIRQESEFNPVAVSRANALGLTQLIPGTGRMMAKGQGISRFQSSLLFEPDVSLKLGAAYLKGQLTAWNGNLEQTLAAYNAGPGRVREWLVAGAYQEPAEFVESIPFTETREYVQAVLRNASVYRRLYEGQPAPAQAKPVTMLSKPVLLPRARHRRRA